MVLCGHGVLPVRGRRHYADPVPTTEFENPLTDTRYRLRLDGPMAWRITKARTTADGHALVRHLRGTTAPGVSPPAEDLDRLVRGEHQVAPNLAADPHLTFAEAVLLDLDRTADHLTTMAHRARLRRERGAPGFRPGCSALRDQERRCMEAALGGCRELGAVWVTSGLGNTAGLLKVPEWLASAVEDADQRAILATAGT
jgi:hypothetical protein